MFYKNADWAIHDGQASKQHPSISSPSALDSIILPCWVPALISFNNGLWLWRYKQKKKRPFFISLIWLCCFLKAIVTMAKKTINHNSGKMWQSFSLCFCEFFCAFWKLAYFWLLLKTRLFYHNHCLS